VKPCDGLAGACEEYPNCVCGRAWKTSRRGFISMLGSGLIVAATPKLFTLDPKVPPGWSASRDGIGLYSIEHPFSARGFQVTRVFVEEQDIKISEIALEDFYVEHDFEGDVYRFTVRPSKGEDHGSGKT
jgi:hypothetical protein